MSFTTLIVLGLVAGGTIYLGLFVGRFPASRPEWRTALSMFAAGILLFLLVDIFADAVGQTSAAWHTGSVAVASWLTVLLIGGFGLGLVGLVVVNNRIVGAARAVGSQQMSLAIATGIGLHNLSEGLAIGAPAAAGQTGLAFGLVAGFAAHNAIEGFGIVGPTLKEGQTSLVAAVGASWSHRRWPLGPGTPEGDLSRKVSSRAGLLFALVSLECSVEGGAVHVERVCDVVGVHAGVE